MGGDQHLILGIDTGSRGAYVSVSEHGYIVSMNTFKNTDESIDFKNYMRDLTLLASQIKIAYVEKVHAIFGASSHSTFTFGRNYQAALCGLEALDIPYVLVTPKEWQKVLLKDTKRVLKKGSKKKTDTKAMAQKAAHKLFVGESFLPTARSKKAHDGLIDAALIARYGLYKDKDKT